MSSIRIEVPQLAIDPYLVIPIGNATSREVYGGELLPDAEVIGTILPVVNDLDFTGLYAAGVVLRGLCRQQWSKTLVCN